MNNVEQGLQNDIPRIQAVMEVLSDNNYLGKNAIRSFEEFAQNCPVRVIKFSGGYSPEETVERACSRLGEKGYNLITNNCDHFATWCKTGKRISILVEGINAVLEMMGFSTDKLEKITLFMNIMLQQPVLLQNK